MTINIQEFQSTALSGERRNATFRLTTDRTGVKCGLGVVQWVKNLRSSKNREVTQTFVDALRQSYGDQITNSVVDSSGLGNELLRGKPLHSKKVVQVLHLAANLQRQFVETNHKIASDYSKPLAAGSDLSLLQIKYEHVAKRLFSGEGVRDSAQSTALMTQLRSHLDWEGLGQEVAQEIDWASRGGTVFVTSEVAAEIADRRITDSLKKAYGAVLMENKLSLAQEGSLSRQTLAKLTSRRGLTINPERVEESVMREINNELEDRVTSAIGRRHIAKQPLVLSEAEQQEIVDKTITKFAGERFAAHAAIDRLPIAEPTKSALLERALHDEVPAHLAPAFAQAAVHLGDSIAVLGRAGASPGEVEQALTRIHDTMLAATKGAGLGVDNRDRVMQAFWKCLLVNASDDQVHDLAGQLERPPLHPFSEGVAYAKFVFVGTEIFDANEEYYLPSVGRAAEYHLLLSSLRRVLGDKQGELAPLAPPTSPEELSDRTLVMLRNVGVRLPAPNRLGQAGNTGLSAAALAEVQRDLDRALGSREPIHDGLTQSFLNDLGRATYTLDGEDLGRNPETIVSRLHQYCTGETDQLNVAMLLGISRYAHQGNFVGILQVFQDEQLSPFQDTPAMGQVAPRYNIAKNDQGGITITSIGEGPVGRIIDPSGSLQRLDPNSSHIRTRQVLTLDANTFKPTLQSVDIEYAFSAAQGGDE